MMPRRTLLACLLAISMAFFSVATHAQSTTTTTGDTTTGNNTSTYKTGSDSPLGPPSGLINLRDEQSVGTNNRSDQFGAALTTGISGSETLQGCGGVTQSDYTSAVFNMPEVFDKFKKDVNTNLAKQILTYNYSLPQTAALFDTLNTYGNARFEQFQQGCKLDAVKQDAKNEFIKACMTPERIGQRKDIIEKANGNSGSGSGGGTGSGSNSQSKFTDDEVSAQAYAQVWELCNNMYVSDTTLVQLHKDVNKAFAESMRGAEDVNAAIRPLLCDTNTGADGTPCWGNLFLPQVRLCNGNSFDEGCDKNGYGIKDPPITVVTYTDFLRFALDDIVTKVIDDFYKKIGDNNVLISKQEQAANAASRDLIMGTEDYSISGYTSIKGLQQYLNCRSDDVTSLLKIYGSKMDVTPATYEPNDYKTLVDKMKFPDTADKDKEAFQHLVHTVVGCTVNQVVPMTDPKITFYLNNKCWKDDRAAFYSIASYDVAISAARDTYRYLDVHLKQVYGRLLNEQGAGISGTIPGATGNNAALDSPELRQRMASVVKEVMIPSVEAQIKRLNELNETRGQFAQRVQKIYKDRQGCVSPDFKLENWSNE